MVTEKPNWPDLEVIKFPPRSIIANYEEVEKQRGLNPKFCDHLTILYVFRQHYVKF